MIKLRRTKCCSFICSIHHSQKKKLETLFSSFAHKPQRLCILKIIHVGWKMNRKEKRIKLSRINPGPSNPGLPLGSESKLVQTCSGKMSAGKVHRRSKALFFVNFGCSLFIVPNQIYPGCTGPLSRLDDASRIQHQLPASPSQPNPPKSSSRPRCLRNLAETKFISLFAYYRRKIS